MRRTMKKTEIKLGIKTNDIRDPILSESMFLTWQWIRDNAPKFKSIKFELGEWEKERPDSDYATDTATKLIVEIEEDS